MNKHVSDPPSHPLQTTFNTIHINEEADQIVAFSNRMEKVKISDIGSSIGAAVLEGGGWSLPAGAARALVKPNK